MKELIEQARSVRELLSDHERWTQSVLAADANDYEVFPNDPTACKFCLIGAVAHVVAKTDPSICSDDGGSVFQTVSAHPLGQAFANVAASQDQGAYSTLFYMQPHAARAAEAIYRLNDNHSHEDVMEACDTVIALLEGAADAGMEV